MIEKGQVGPGCTLWSSTSTSTSTPPLYLAMAETGGREASEGGRRKAKREMGEEGGGGVAQGVETGLKPTANIGRRGVKVGTTRAATQSGEETVGKRCPGALVFPHSHPHVCHAPLPRWEADTRKRPRHPSRPSSSKKRTRFPMFRNVMHA